MKNILILISILLFTVSGFSQSVENLEIADGKSKNVQYIPISYNGKGLLSSVKQILRGKQKGHYVDYRLQELVDSIKVQVREEISDSLTTVGGGGLSYDVYTAIMSQTGTDAPTAEILENTLSGTPTWSYTAEGVYTATLSNAFDETKTFLYARPNFETAGAGYITVGQASGQNDAVKFQCYGDGSLGTLVESGSTWYVEIRVYP